MSAKRCRQDDGAGASTARRGFLKGLAGVLLAAAGAILGLPLLRSVFGSAPQTAGAWSRAGSVAGLAPDTPVEMTFEALETDAYLHRTTLRSAWVIRSGTGRIDVFSPVCPHLGCHVLWNPASGRFECPCHASVFAPDGRVLGGPAPRPLDSLAFRTEGDALFVRWTQFRAGTPEKTAA